MNFVRMHRLAAVLLLLVGVGLAGCAGGGGCASGKCGLPNIGSSNQPKIGVSPYRGRYIEGGHGWR